MNSAILPLKNEIKNFLKANFRDTRAREKLILWAFLVLLFISIFVCLIVAAFFTGDEGDKIVGIVGAILLVAFIISWLSITQIQRKFICIKVSKEANKHFGNLYLLANTHFTDSLIEQKNMGTWTLFTWTGTSTTFQIKAPISHKKPITFVINGKNVEFDNEEKKLFCHKLSLSIKNIKNRSVSLSDFQENTIEIASQKIADYIFEDFKTSLIFVENIIYENK